MRSRIHRSYITSSRKLVHVRMIILQTVFIFPLVSKIKVNSPPFYLKEKVKD